MKEFWDTRYDVEEFVYGKEPNWFFASTLQDHSPGQLLLPGEGEGRNAVFAAKSGWSTDAFDQSVIAHEKAMEWAQLSGVNIHYQVCTIHEYPFQGEHYDAVGLIFLHSVPEIRKYLHRKVVKSLKPGGLVILEAFHTRQLEYRTAGPQSLEMLMDREMIRKDFAGMETLHYQETDEILNEGRFHQGISALVRYIGRKT